MATGKPKFLNTIDQCYIDGDVLITDPCYLDSGIDNNDWMSTVSSLNLNPYIESSTIYGDWGCSVYDCTNVTEDDNEHIGIKIGHFCADAGMVCVCEYNNVIKANPHMEKWIAEHNWCACVIKNFKGTVKINRRQCKYVDDEENIQTEDIIMVEGEGTKDGKPFKFQSVQTSL